MPRTYKSKPGCRKYNSSPRDNLERAAAAYRTGLSQRQVCKDFNIGRSTFQLYLLRQVPDAPNRAPGGQPILSSETEHHVVQHIQTVSEWGFPFDSMDIRMTIKRLLDKEGRTVKLFKENLPGKEWFRSFLRRHKDALNDRMCQNIKKKRSKIDAESIKAYFHELEKSLRGVPPENIINYDETNLTDDPGRKKFIFKRGVRYPERIMNSSKSSTSLMLAGTASGTVLPVYVVYKAEHLWNTWTEGGPRGARYNRSKSGWFDQVTFEDWFRSVALPYCNRLEGKKILLGDNLSSHFSDDVLKQCSENNISFVCMLPNSTHLCQPLDVAFFGPMKTAWRQILTRYKLMHAKNAGTIPKDTFPKLLNKLMEAIDPRAADNLKAGFRKCGVCPFDVEPVLQRLPSTSGLDVSNGSVSEAFVEHLRVLREGDTVTPRRNKRTRLDVVPGRSVNTPGDNDTEPELQQTAGPSNAGSNDAESSGAESDSESSVDIPGLNDLISSEDEWTPQQSKRNRSRNVFDTFQ